MYSCWSSYLANCRVLLHLLLPVLHFLQGIVVEYGLAGFNLAQLVQLELERTSFNPATSPQVFRTLISTSYDVYTRTLCGCNYSANDPLEISRHYLLLLQMTTVEVLML